MVYNFFIFLNDLERRSSLRFHSSCEKFKNILIQEVNLSPTYKGYFKFKCREHINML